MKKHSYKVGDRVKVGAQYTYRGGRVSTRSHMTGTIARLLNEDHFIAQGYKPDWDKIVDRNDPEYFVHWDKPGPSGNHYADESCLTPLEPLDVDDLDYISKSFGTIGKPEYTDAERAAFKAGWDAASREILSAVQQTIDKR